MASLLPPEAADDVHPLAFILEGGRKSKFDELLEERWQQAPLWYLLGNLPKRRLPGRFGFVVELNEQRAEKKRKPEDIRDLRQPFDPRKFNFNKVHDREVLFRDDENALVVNVAPLGWCHCLVVPSVSRGLPQVLTAEGLNLTLDLMFRSGSADLRGGFNSLGGLASVNHQHLHLYHVKHRLTLETLLVTPIGSKIFSLDEYPAKGLLVYVSIKHRSSVAWLLRVTNLLLDNKIAFNVFLTRGCEPGICRNEAPTSYEVIRIYLWARKPFFGVKGTKNFSVALSELAGHVPVKTKDTYDSLSEQQVMEQQKLVCDESFEQMMKLLNENKLLTP